MQAIILYMKKLFFLLVCFTVLVACKKEDDNTKKTTPTSVLMQIFSGDSLNNWYADNARIFSIIDSFTVVASHYEVADSSVFFLSHSTKAVGSYPFVLGGRPIVTFITNNPYSLYVSDSGTLQIIAHDTATKYLQGNYNVRVTNGSKTLRLQGEFDGSY